MKKASTATRQKMSEAHRKFWASLSPEERSQRGTKIADNYGRGKQLRRIKQKALPTHFPLASNFVDPDFDEGF